MELTTQQVLVMVENFIQSILVSIEPEHESVYVHEVIYDILLHYRNTYHAGFGPLYLMNLPVYIDNNILTFKLETNHV